jgi:hypothetical protein
MRTIEKTGAQGDVFFTRVEATPPGFQEAKVANGVFVIAHSETGHHHTVRADGVVFYEGPNDPFTCYLRIDGPYADVVHHRTYDTHETMRLTQGTWLVRRQREYTPEGFRRVED